LVRADLAAGFAAGLWAGGIVGAAKYLSMIWADHLEKERAAAWKVEQEREAKRAAWLADLPPLPNEGGLTHAWALCPQLEISGAWFRAQMPKDGDYIQIPVVGLTNADLLVLQKSFRTRAAEDPGLNANPGDRDRCYRTKWARDAVEKEITRRRRALKDLEPEPDFGSQPAEWMPLASHVGRVSEPS
jgi:hypothetical protein